MSPDPKEHISLGELGSMAATFGCTDLMSGPAGILGGLCELV